MGDACDCCCNVIWFIFGGFEMCIIWCITGVILCCTICGIPIGLQCFKIGCFALCPFGKDITYKDDPLSCCNCFLNIIWILTGGLFLYHNMRNTFRFTTFQISKTCSYAFWSRCCRKRCYSKYWWCHCSTSSGCCCSTRLYSSCSTLYSSTGLLKNLYSNNLKY